MSLPVSRRLAALVVIALAAASAYQLTRPAPVSFTSPSRPAPTQELAIATEPLHFSPPAAGVPVKPVNPAYEACIDQPSFDGAIIECQLLLARPATASKPRRNH